MESERHDGDQGAIRTLEGRYRRIQAVESARHALLARPSFSLKLQIHLGFFAVFLFAVGIATGLVWTMLRMEKKLVAMEVFNDFLIEVDQARRFEKNYFLYGANLSDALENIYKADTLLERNRNEFARMLGEQGLKKILADMENYRTFLDRLGELERKKPALGDLEARKGEIELDLRKYGQKMVLSAQNLVEKEKQRMSSVIRWSRNIHIFFLVWLLIFMAFTSYLLVRHILSTIHRFQAYAERIAGGDFTPITPARRFRDEFTDLAIAINQMIAELEGREAYLIQSHKMRAVGTLTAGVAHELNNPLNNILLTAHMLLEDYEGLEDEELKEMIQDVANEAGRSKHIIANLLDFARESGAQLEPLDLKSLLEDTVRLASNRIKLSGIKIEFQSTDNLPRVHGDGQQLRQVFLNLILNAIDASPRKGKIQVLVAPADEPGYVAVKVVDFGTGIPEHILGSVFDPFFTTKGKDKGTGLGLSVSQGIVGKHGGRIRVSSEEGKGSTFTVILPVTTIPADIDAASA